MKNLILGIDAATTSTGVGILEDGELIFSDKIQPPVSVKNPFERIAFIQQRMAEIYAHYNIRLMVLEDIGLNYELNLEVAKNNLLLIGTCIAIANENNVALMLLKPAEWRKAVGIYGEKVSKDELKREFQKKKGIELADRFFGFDFVWVSEYQDKKDHNSDVAEAALIAFAGHKIFQKGGSLDGQEDDL